MSGTHFEYLIYFDIHTYDWLLIPDKNLNFCIKNSVKEVGKATISLYQIYHMLNYGIITIHDTRKIEDISENIMFTTYFKNLSYFDILNINGELVGTSNLLIRSKREKDFITYQEKSFYNVLELVKYKYKVNNNFIPEELWSIIYSYLEPYQERIMCAYDGNIEYCQEMAYDLYIYDSSRIQKEFYYYAIPYPHTKKESRRAICKFNNWDDNVAGLNLIYRANLYRENDISDNYSLYLYRTNKYCNDTDVYLTSETKIKYINKEGQEIYHNNMLQLNCLKSYKINSIHTL